MNDKKKIIWEGPGRYVWSNKRQALVKVKPEGSHTFSCTDDIVMCANWNPALDGNYTAEDIVHIQSIQLPEEEYEIVS